MSTNDKLADALDELCDAVRVYDRCPDKYNHNAMTEARAAVASLAAPPAQREWVMVPRVPTGEMVQYGFDAMRTDNVRDSSEQGRVRRIYGAMLARAPHPAPAPVHPCTMGVGCEEAGVCYASANGQPEQCGAHQPAPDPAADGAGNHVFHLTNIRDQVSQDGLADSDYQVSAIDAAIAALAQQRVPDAVRELPPVDLTKFRDAVEFWRDHAKVDHAHGVVTRADRLLALIASQQESRNAD